jgi:NIMA (never in mitosis gene a)-related kinase
MLKTAMQNRLQGRTLVELQQARNVPVINEREPLKPNKSDGSIKTAVAMVEHQIREQNQNEAPVWDPEKEIDMPSPFLVRTRGLITRSR